MSDDADDARRRRSAMHGTLRSQPRLSTRLPAKQQRQDAPTWPPPKAEPARKSGLPLLWATGLRKSHDGERVQFANVDVVLERGAKMALVGANGCGKSTLLRALSKPDDPAALDGGEVAVRKGTTLAYLPQEPAFLPEQRVLEAVLAGDAPVLRLVRRYQAALLATAADVPGAAAELAALGAEMDASSAWGVEADVRATLLELGCAEFLDKTMGQLSGGQRKRVSLATALLASPDILVLDEPTNHLSIGGTEWLESRLKDPALTLLMVTHDRAFLDACCTDVLELDGAGGAFRHSASSGDAYARFLLGRAERLAAQQAAADNAATVLRREEVWMAKQPRARQAKSVARQAAFYTLQAAAQAVPQRMGTLDLQEGVKASRMGDVAVELKAASLTLGESRILQDFSYTFSKGERVGIVGPNGVGKSTFLNICRGVQPVDSGAVVIGETVRFGVYEQFSSFARPQERVADYVKQLAADAREEDAQGRDWNGWTVTELLKRFQFSGRQATPICELSGGERRRLQLLTMLARRPNLIIMDEPTNDLDLDTIEAMEEMLLGFDGIILLTGHDRAFMDTLAQHIFVFEGDGVLRDWHGTYSELREAQKAAEAEAAKPPPAAAAKPAARDAAADKEARRLASNASKKLPKVEAAIEAAEAAIAALDGELVAAGADAGKAAVLGKQREAESAKLDELYEEYERLDAVVNAAAA